MSGFADVNFKTRIDREIHDHEVFMSFRNDDDAVNFHSWWHDEGSEVFMKWLEIKEKF